MGISHITTLESMAFGFEIPMYLSTCWPMKLPIFTYLHLSLSIYFIALRRSICIPINERYIILACLLGLLNNEAVVIGEWYLDDLLTRFLVDYSKICTGHSLAEQDPSWCCRPRTGGIIRGLNHQLINCSNNLQIQLCFYLLFMFDIWGTIVYFWTDRSPWFMGLLSNVIHVITVVYKYSTTKKNWMIFLALTVEL